MRLLSSGLRTLVVTLDPKRNELQKDAPAAMLRTLGHTVEVVGYDLAELKGAVDVALVEAGEHLEIGRHAIRRLRQRPELVATRILLYEFQLLRFLADRVGRVFTRQELLSRVWGYRHVGRVRTVDTHVLNLRAKLGALGDRLQSVRGMGYKLQRADTASDGNAAA
jgi:hypothetical protein